MGLDFLSQVECSCRSVGMEGLSGLRLWLLYHCHVRCEFSSVALSLSEESKSGTPCHVKQRTVCRMVPLNILQRVFREKRS